MSRFEKRAEKRLEDPQVRIGYLEAALRAAQDSCESYMSEVERLRAALERIASFHEHGPECFGFDGPDMVCEIPEPSAGVEACHALGHLATEDEVVGGGAVPGSLLPPSAYSEDED